MTEDFKFIGGTNGCVNFCWVMKGCSLACCGDHLSNGLMVNNPRTKSMNATRLLSSRGKGVSFNQSNLNEWKGSTSINFCLLHVLPRHRIISNDFAQVVRLKISLARLFFGVMFARVLLKTFEPIGSPAKFILRLLEKFASLFPHFNHPVRRHSHHFYYSRNLVVFRGSGK